MSLCLLHFSLLVELEGPVVVLRVQLLDHDYEAILVHQSVFLIFDHLALFWLVLCRVWARYQCFDNLVDIGLDDPLLLVSLDVDQGHWALREVVHLQLLFWLLIICARLIGRWFLVILLMHGQSQLVDFRCNIVDQLERDQALVLVDSTS